MLTLEKSLASDWTLVSSSQFHSIWWCPPVTTEWLAPNARFPISSNISSRRRETKTDENRVWGKKILSSCLQSRNKVSRKATAKILVSLWVSPKATAHCRNVGSIVLRSMVFIPTIPVFLRNVKMLNNFVCAKKLKVEMTSSACLAVIVVAASMNQSCVLRRAKYPEPLAEGYQTVNSWNK